MITLTENNTGLTNQWSKGQPRNFRRHHQDEK